MAGDVRDRLLQVGGLAARAEAELLPNAAAVSGGDAGTLVDDECLQPRDILRQIRDESDELTGQHRRDQDED